MTKFESFLQVVLVVLIMFGGALVYDTTANTNRNTELIDFKLSSISNRLDEIKSPVSREASKPTTMLRAVSLQDEDFDFDSAPSVPPAEIQTDESACCDRLMEQLDRLELMLQGSRHVEPSNAPAMIQTGAFENGLGGVIEDLIFGSPPIENYSAPIVQSSAPIVQSYSAPIVQSYSAPIVQSYSAPIVQSYSAPIVQSVPVASVSWGSTGHGSTGSVRVRQFRAPTQQRSLLGNRRGSSCPGGRCRWGN